MLLAGCQIGVAIAVAWGAALINRAFPYWPIDPALAPGPWFNFQIDLLRAFIAVVPAACFWGASFPLALAAAGRAPATRRGSSAPCMPPTRLARWSAPSSSAS